MPSFRLLRIPMVRTRFAPSPTGYLHIGGVRSALFNWILAKQSGGQFILRIDDTDQQRNVKEALQPILDGFRWLGMDWDEGPEVGGPHGPYFQSERSDLYGQAAAQLLASGHAYRDCTTTEELQAQRQAAEKAGRAFVYDRQWMAEDDATAEKFAAEGRSCVVRLKMPREGECVIQDAVRGEVRVQWASEQDHVIQRADGSCLYHLASVVDDHAMQISHVVRAEEHLPNTPRQIFIAESLGYALPQYAHLPYVAEPGGTPKLSKRKLAKYLKNPEFAQLMQHGQRIAERAGRTGAGRTVDPDTFNPVIVDFYREIGFDADAILNYLLLLGWSLDGEREKFTVAEMTRHFTLERVNKAPASFDPRKLLAFQGDVFAALPLETRLERVRPFAQRAGLLEGPDAEAKLRQIVDGAGDRLAMAGDILNFDYFFFDDFDYDVKAFEKRICKPAQARELLASLRAHLATEGMSGSVVSGQASAQQRSWRDPQEAEEAVMAFCRAAKIELKDIIHALRVAATGTPAGFGMFETLAILGPSKVMARI